jgi:hypothetical protein
MKLHILQLILIQAKVVAQFVDDCQADLFADFVLVGADRFNILLHLCPNWAQVSHQNGNGLDNIRENLRGVRRAA